jgi:hypothetical protein
MYFEDFDNDLLNGKSWLRHSGEVDLILIGASMSRQQ